MPPSSPNEPPFNSDPLYCACKDVDLQSVEAREWVDDQFVIHRLDGCSDADGCPNDD